MNKAFLSDGLVFRLRAMASQRASIRMMIQEIRNDLGTDDGLAFVVGRYFKEAFFLGVGDVRHVAGCKWLGGMAYDENQIDELMLPLIASTRNKWEQEVKKEATDEESA